ncbi:hypothetical protein C3495_14315 (plasmid) [Clostridiaceae bacterium 14S0207]|nr:hypothetical protein C3495_14315 [Clostridiaceae bacterium 14S0207]
MEIGDILKDKQPQMYKKLVNVSEKKVKNKKKNKSEKLSFSYVSSLMRHDSYERHHGAIRQK